MENCALCEKLNKLLAEAEERNKGMVAGMIKPYLIDCDYNGRRTLIGFPAQDWERNPNGVIHGGIIATMMDTAMGITTICIVDSLTPTINLHISYLRPCPADGILAVKSQITMEGGSVVQLRAEMYDTREPDVLIATAEGAFRRFKNAKPMEW